MKEATKKISNVINTIKSKGFYPNIKTIEGMSTGTEVIIEGKKVLLFCSYNYLGFSGNKEIENEVIKGIKEYGLGSGGTPMVSGTLDIHKKLERKISDFMNIEDAMLFTNGALANIGIIPAIATLPKFTMEYLFKSFFKLIFGKEDVYILSDELNHATIVDGARIPKVKILVYKHKDLKDLEEKLKITKKSWKLIVTDGVFSMDGDIAPLPHIAELAKKYNALLMVDDAHSTGVLGKHGRGTMEHFGMSEGVDLQMGSLGKAIGLTGGFIGGSSDIIAYLRVTARPYIFSGSVPGSFAKGIIKAIELNLDAEDKRIKLWENSNYFRNSLKNLGFNTFQSEDPTPIIPLLIGDDKKSMYVTDALLENGIFAPAIRFPAVPRGSSRIRFTLMADHTKDQIDYVIKILEKLNAKFEFNK